jgi:hypothetical protein
MSSNIKRNTDSTPDAGISISASDTGRGRGIAMTSTDVDTRQARRKRALATAPAGDAVSNGQAPRRLTCATPDRPSLPGRFDTTGGSWDRRTFTYAFSTGPGSSGTLPQTLSFTDAKKAVTRAFTTWSTQGGVLLDFEEVGLNDDPHIIVEWVPVDHSEEAKAQTNGAWIISDTTSLANTSPTNAPLAHADFPPESASNDPDATQAEPPIAIHFDDEETTWTKTLVESVALHEIGHTLGLDHQPQAGLPAGQNAVMEPNDQGLTDLQNDDVKGIKALYGVPGPERFNWIWMEGTLRRRALWGWRRNDLQEEVDRQATEGYRIMRVNAYVLPTQTLYNAVFERINQERHYATNRTRESFDEERANWEGQGLKLIDVNNFVGADGEVRFNGVWARAGEDIRPFVGITLDEVNQELENARANDFRPILINGYETSDGEQRWNLLIIRQGHAGDPRAWEAHVNVTRDEFDARSAELEEQYDQTCIHTLVLPGGREQRWSGIWEEIHIPSRTGWDWIREDFERRTANLEEQVEGLQVWDLNAYVRPPTPTTTTLASLEQAPTGQRFVVLGLALDEQYVYAIRYRQTIEPPHTSVQPGVLVVLDRQTLQPVPQLPQFPGFPRGVPVGFGPRSVAVNPVTRKIYSGSHTDHIQNPTCLKKPLASLGERVCKA